MSMFTTYSYLCVEFGLWDWNILLFLCENLLGSGIRRWQTELQCLLIFIVTQSVWTPYWDFHYPHFEANAPLVVYFGLMIKRPSLVLSFLAERMQILVQDSCVMFGVQFPICLNETPSGTEKVLCTNILLLLLHTAGKVLLGQLGLCARRTAQHSDQRILCSLTRPADSLLHLCTVCKLSETSILQTLSRKRCYLFSIFWFRYPTFLHHQLQPMSKRSNLYFCITWTT